jgi:hypothetical protein
MKSLDTPSYLTFGWDHTIVFLIYFRFAGRTCIFLIMGSLSENRRLMQIARGVIYPMAISLVVLFAFEIISPSMTLISTTLDLSQTARPYDVASKARVYQASGRPGNEEAQELLLESLTLLRDVMVDIKSGSK